MLFTKDVLLNTDNEFLRKSITFSNGYAMIGREYLHRLIINAGPTDIVDHINGNVLDNRLTNLRICTQQQNTYNRPKTGIPRTSKYKGVCWRKASNAWVATIVVDRVQIYLGGFQCEHEAAFKRDIAAKKYHKEFAYLNFNLDLP